MKHEADMLWKGLPIAGKGVDEHFRQRRYLVQGHNDVDFNEDGNPMQLPNRNSFEEGETPPNREPQATRDMRLQERISGAGDRGGKMEQILKNNLYNAEGNPPGKNI